jgi:DNA-binding NtrC family response regulator
MACVVSCPASFSRSGHTTCGALVFSDIVMPGGMTGYDVGEWVHAMRPDLKVLLTSGYSDMPVEVSDAVRETKVLGKPYTREQLAHALREALDA